MLCMIWGTQYFLTRVLSVLFPDIFFPKISQKDPLRKRVFATMKQFFVEFVLICFPATAIITDVNVYIYNLVLILLFVVLLIIARKSILSVLLHSLSAIDSFCFNLFFLFERTLY